MTDTIYTDNSKVIADLQAKNDALVARVARLECGFKEIKSRQRGDRVIRQRFTDEAAETVSVERAYLSGLCSQVARYEKAAEDAKRRADTAEEDLCRAKALIARLRAENEVLKAEKRRFIGTVDATKRHISIAGNAHKKWAVTLVKAQLEKARLI